MHHGIGHTVAYSPEHQTWELPPTWGHLGPTTSHTGGQPVQTCLPYDPPNPERHLAVATGAYGRTTVGFIRLCT